MKYRVYLTTKVNPKKLEKGKGIYVIESEDYSKEEVKQIKNKGYTVLAYLSIGTIEKERTWWKDYKKFALKPLKDWPNEHYADMSKKTWLAFLVDRARSLKKKGFDGWWLDNVDVYEYYPTKEILAGTKSVIKQIKKLGGYVMINGGSRFLNKADMAGIIDGYTQEEVFSRIKSYKGDGTFGKQDADEKVYYQKTIAASMKKGIECYLLEYTKSDALKQKIREYCMNGKCTGYYISGKVNL